MTSIDEIFSDLFPLFFGIGTALYMYSAINSIEQLPTELAIIISAFVGITIYLGDTDNE